MSTKPLTAQGNSQSLGLVPGLVLTFVLALVAKQLASLPYLNLLGSMVLAILVGMAWRHFMEVPETAFPGITFASKNMLRYGIILLGLRLNIPQILASGPQVLLLDLGIVFTALTFIPLLAKKAGLPGNYGSLIAIGTGICGASAIAATAPVIKAHEEEVAISVGIISLAGTFMALAYALLYPVLHFSSSQFGLFSGSTLQELGHVIAAAQAGGPDSLDLAILVKLGRVALLVPVVLLLGIYYNLRGNKTTPSCQKLPFPWFILGFLALSMFNTWHILPPVLVSSLIQLGVFLLTMGMVGLGLNVNLDMVRRVGSKGLSVGFLGSLFLTLYGYLVITWLQF
ncbi:conserved hypothetical integral membrane protein [Thermanaeromonas toyohensis ToBE]|uniref:Conserved hypothetical integral membrane protein n=1 Tax=Thermanaeromonas toyohensis ToBE TaxID=698762 RepID=A0A1W1VI07_9FIRM|nr:YeiH family protein [Thermanaeromonas toyohensis]SMB92594.1 conserved hypothetical integral membrane protein [Thermanaeromonas toyohensis ToBE]